MHLHFAELPLRTGVQCSRTLSLSKRCPPGNL